VIVLWKNILMESMIARHLSFFRKLLEDKRGVFYHRICHYIKSIYFTAANLQ